MGKTIPVSADIWEAGTHLISPRGLYTHHGIYIGNGQVIHYSGLADGLNDNGDPGIICQVSLKEFEKGNPSHARSIPQSRQRPSRRPCLPVSKQSNATQTSSTALKHSSPNRKTGGSK